MKIAYLNAFTDNYIWLLHNDTQIVVVDPGESAQVLDYIIANKLCLKAILLTHDHVDHIGGVADILAHYNVPVYGTCDIATTKLVDGQLFPLFDGISARVIATPGHTLNSICYLVRDKNTQHLFCGDTLFGAGCGRVFSGDFAAMYKSLGLLANLDPQTLIYPAHEYTLRNLQFAQFIEPNSSRLSDRVTFESEQIARKYSTLPTSVQRELETNPFLRCNEQSVAEAVSHVTGKPMLAGFETFVQLRDLRNNF